MEPFSKPAARFAPEALKRCFGSCVSAGCYEWRLRQIMEGWHEDVKPGAPVWLAVSWRVENRNKGPEIELASMCKQLILHSYGKKSKPGRVQNGTNSVANLSPSDPRARNGNQCLEVYV